MIGPVKKRWYRGFVVLLCIAHSALLAYMAFQDAPTEVEIAHLPSGISHWQTGSFFYFRQNPPLVRLGAAIITLPFSPRVAWKGYSNSPAARPEFPMGRQFIELNGERSLLLFSIARLACIPWSILGALVCFYWARALFGPLSGIVAATLWCFCPMVLGHGHTINPDMPGAAAGIAASYAFWIWLRTPSSFTMSVTGIALALALSTKSTWIIAFALWPFIWAISCWQAALPWSKLRHQGLQLLGMFSFAILLVNCLYGFEGSFTQLRDYRFVSRSLSGVDTSQTSAVEGNRFASTWLGSVPVPLPKYFVEGIDVQRSDFERPFASYLSGEWKQGSWWYYYLYAMLVKTPVGTLGLILLSLIGMFLQPQLRRRLIDELSLAVPVVGITLLCCAQSSMGTHYRYFMPALPFLFVWSSRAALYCQNCGTRQLRTLAAILILAVPVESMWTYPHSISFFNMFVGGPANGWRHLLGSSLDWGQDLIRLRSWQRESPDHAHLKVALGSYVPPAAIGVDGMAVKLRAPAMRECKPDDITPGWYAISKSYLWSRHDVFSEFRPLRRSAQIGYTTDIFYLEPGDASSIKSRASLIAAMRDALQAEPWPAFPIRVGILSNGRGPVPKHVEKAIAGSDRACVCMSVSIDNVAKADFDGIDVLFVPGGSATELATLLGESGTRNIQEFVRNGGGYVGICAGAYLATAGYGVEIVEQIVTNRKSALRPSDPDTDQPTYVPLVELKLTDSGRDILGHDQARALVHFSSGPLLAPVASRSELPLVTLATFSYAGGGELLRPEALGSPAIIASSYGRGRVVLFSPHPEGTEGLNHWVANAVRAVSQRNK